jgi:hypothetical protein
MIYIGEFFHLTNQQEVQENQRRHGEFYMIVEAADRQSAVNLFKEKIVSFRRNSHFFEGACKIFFIQLFELKQFPQNEALILNMKSVAGDPLMPFIGCSVPTMERNACRIYDWKNNAPDIEGESDKLFLSFEP